MQQGMLRTFGRVMPILLPLTAVPIVATAIVPGADLLRSGDQLPNLGYAAEYLRADPRFAS
jgi:hypothetical protein